MACLSGYSEYSEYSEPWKNQVHSCEYKLKVVISSSKLCVLALQVASFSSLSSRIKHPLALKLSAAATATAICALAVVWASTSSSEVLWSGLCYILTTYFSSHFP
jgi:hypothetical protein